MANYLLGGAGLSFFKKVVINTLIEALVAG